VGRDARPTDLGAAGWWEALRAAVGAFRDRELTDNAAALTYYSVLSLFPFLIVLVSLLGMLGSDESIDRLLRIVDDLGAASSVDTVEPAIEGIVRTSGGTAGIGLVLGILVGLWTASGYVGAFIRTSNWIHGVTEDRPFWKLRPLQLLITLTLVSLIAVVLIVVVLSGPLAQAIGDELGVGETAQEVYSVARWPLLAAVVVGLITLLYRFSPDVGRRRLRWILPGSLLATILWLLGSAGFNLYVSNFGSYSSTYGSLAGVIVFLIWLWITNIAVVFGAQLSYELERMATAESDSRPGLRPG
jgi:membrane protein